MLQLLETTLHKRELTANIKANLGKAKPTGHCTSAVVYQIITISLQYSATSAAAKGIHYLASGPRLENLAAISGGKTYFVKDGMKKKDA